MGDLFGRRIEGESAGWMAQEPLGGEGGDGFFGRGRGQDVVYIDRNGFSIELRTLLNLLLII